MRRLSLTAALRLLSTLEAELDREYEDLDRDLE